MNNPYYTNNIPPNNYSNNVYDENANTYSPHYYQGPPNPQIPHEQYSHYQQQQPPPSRQPPNSYNASQMNRYSPSPAPSHPPYDERIYSDRPPSTPSSQQLQLEHEYSYYQQQPPPPSQQPPNSYNASRVNRFPPSLAPHRNSSVMNSQPYDERMYPRSERTAFHYKYQPQAHIFPQSNDWKLASNDEIIGRALKLMNEGMRPFIHKVMFQTYGPSWLEVAQKETSPPSTRPNLIGPIEESTPGYLEVVSQVLDSRTILLLITKMYTSLFSTTLSQSDRNISHELKFIRNEWAHQKPISDTDTYRALDNVERLLLAIKAPQAGELERGRLIYCCVLADRVHQNDILKQSLLSDTRFIDPNAQSDESLKKTLVQSGWSGPSMHFNESDVDMEDV